MQHSVWVVEHVGDQVIVTEESDRDVIGCGGTYIVHRTNGTLETDTVADPVFDRYFLRRSEAYDYAIMRQDLIIQRKINERALLTIHIERLYDAREFGEVAA